MDYPDAGPTNEELQAVKDVIASFLIGLKNYSLYPENHSICQKSVANAAECLDGFLKIHGNLSLEVEKDHLLYKNQVVFQEHSGTENLTKILFRDGIHWLQFLEGFEIQELTGFFRILKDYKTWNEDSEGDLVTAFWEANFPNFRYKAVDACWESEPLLDFSHLNQGSVRNFEDDESEEETHSSLTVTVEESQGELWKLTDEETQKLRDMITDEENRDNLTDLLFVFFALSKDSANKEAIHLALEFLKDALKTAIVQDDYHFAFRLLSALSQIRNANKGQKTWIKDNLDRFFREVSGPEVMDVVSEGLASLDELSPPSIEHVRQFLLLLNPDVILTLGPLLSKIRSLDLQRQILDIVAKMAMKDMHPLEQLIKSTDEFMVQKLVTVFDRLKEKIPTRVLLKMLRNPSPRIRKQAVSHLAGPDTEVIKKLFGLVEDPDDAVRNLVLRTLGNARSEVAEDIFLDYLGKRQFAITDHQHLLACYRTLGQCGSHRSLPSLKKLLFNRGWFPDLGRSVHRRGAAVALITLGTKEAKEVLQKASASLFPSVRLACRKAVEVIQ